MKKTYIDVFDHIEEGSEVEFFAPSDNDPHAILEREQLRHVIELALISITERGTYTRGSKIRARDIKMLRMVYGLDSTQPLPHYRVGAVFDMSGNRVSQIIHRIFERLKMPEINININELYEYLKED
tara:strand:- start:702 stop:1082 length:381 start_codon:yes stop_codon:yes gene_type:complete